MLRDRAIVALSTSCLGFYHTYQYDLQKRALQKLLQAVVDEDQKTVKRMLDHCPGLLLADPGKLEIESKYTWLRFRAAKALEMAGKRKQVEMVQLLLPYFDVLEQSGVVKNGKAEAFGQWTPPNVRDPQVLARLKEKNQKLQIDYRSLLQPLVNEISKERCRHGFDGKLSKKTEKKLASFKKKNTSEESCQFGSLL